MSYEALANATAVTHIGAIILVVVGLLVCFRYRRFRPWEAGVLLAVVVLWSYYGNCPLTILEEHFRILAGSPSGITNVGFLPFYVNKFLSLTITSGTVQRFTFFTGGTIFAASIEWLSPYFHFHLFHFRRSLRRSLRKAFV